MISTVYKYIIILFYFIYVVFFTNVQLNCPIVYDIEHFISEGNSFILYTFIYKCIIHAYIYLYIYILMC